MSIYDVKTKTRVQSGRDGRKYGLYGKDILHGVSNQVSPTGVYYDALQFMAETVFTIITDEELYTGTHVGVHFPAGTIVQGRFTGLTVTPGSTGIVYAYRVKKR